MEKRKFWGRKSGLAIVLTVFCLTAGFWFFRPLSYDGKGPFGAETEEGLEGKPQLVETMGDLEGRLVLLSADRYGMWLRWDWHWLRQPRVWTGEAAQILWRAQNAQGQALLLSMDKEQSRAVLQYGVGDQAELCPAPVDILDSMGAVSVTVPVQKGRTAAKGTLFLRVGGQGGGIAQSQFEFCYGECDREMLSRGIPFYLKESSPMRWRKAVNVTSAGQMEWTDAVLTEQQ